MSVAEKSGSRRFLMDFDLTSFLLFALLPGEIWTRDWQREL